MPPDAVRRMLIYRDYLGYTGGHGKFRDYIGHIEAHPAWAATVYLTPRSDRATGNPFLDVPNLLDQWAPAQAGALLLGGMDWTALPAKLDARLPIVNLVQHVRHADPQSPLRAFLPRRAIRICNSTIVADALRATGEANGPLLVIPSAVDTALLAGLGAAPCSNDVFIDAVKQPALGQEVFACLAGSGLRVQLQIARLPFPDYLESMAAATIVLPLPHPTEGIYLPGLNAMAMGRALVQPDCVGSREYVRDGENALVPLRDTAALADAVLRLHGDADLRARLVAAGRQTAALFDLAAERLRVHALLDEIDDLWTS